MRARHCHSNDKHCWNSCTYVGNWLLFKCRKSVWKCSWWLIKGKEWKLKKRSHGGSSSLSFTNKNAELCSPHKHILNKLIIIWSITWLEMTATSFFEQLWCVYMWCIYLTYHVVQVFNICFAVDILAVVFAPAQGQAQAPSSVRPPTRAADLQRPHALAQPQQSTQELLQENSGRRHGQVSVETWLSCLHTGHNRHSHRLGKALWVTVFKRP